MFIYKLFQIYKTNFEDHHKLNENNIINNIFCIMTKNTILAVISIGAAIITTLNHIMFVVWFNDIDSEIIHCISDSLYLLDISTNFFCIILSFAVNHRYYLLSCKCLDKRCKSFCNIIIDLSQNNKDSDKIASKCEKDVEKIEITVPSNVT